MGMKTSKTNLKAHKLTNDINIRFGDVLAGSGTTNGSTPVTIGTTLGNGVALNANVPSMVAKPTVSVVVDGSNVINTNFAVTSSAMVALSGLNAIHESTDWRVTTDGGSKNIVINEPITGSLNDWNIDSQMLDTGVEYWVSCRYRHGNVVSPWSDSVPFIANATSIIKKPIINSPISGVKVNVNGTVVVDSLPFSATGGTYTNTVIEASLTSDFAVVTNAVSDVGTVAGYANLSSTLTGLGAGKTYYVRIRYVGSNGTSVNSNSIIVNVTSVMDNVKQLEIVQSLVDVTYPTALRFGSRVALSGDGMVMAVYYGISGAGEEVLIYDKVAEVFVYRNTLPVVVSDDFCNGLALNGTGSRLVVGDSTNGTNEGAINVYDWNGTTWHLTSSMVDSVRTINAYWGDTVGISADGLNIVVGASSTAPGARGNGTGSMSLIESVPSTGWLEGSILTASDAGASDFFGHGATISKDGSVLVVGAHGWDGPAGTDQGGVYVYDWNGSSWIQRGSVLTASDAGASDFFGHGTTISADGSVLVVGAYGWDGTATDQGGVYIYDWNGSSWIQRGAVLTASDAGASDYFGVSTTLSADGSVLVVGAHSWGGPAGTNQGGVYIYDWNGSSWIQRGSVLTASDAGDSDWFGISTTISADGSVLVVGAYGWDGPAGTDQGGVYVYDWNGSSWIQRGAVLTASDAGASDQYGVSAALSADGSVLVVGARFWDGPAGTDQGGVYIYDWNGTNWIQRGTVLTASDAGAGDKFGRSVSLNTDGSVLVVGAYAWDGTFTDQGTVYTYTLVNNTWVETLRYQNPIPPDTGLISGLAVGISGDGLSIVGIRGRDSENTNSVFEQSVLRWSKSTGAWVLTGDPVRFSYSVINSISPSVSLTHDGTILAVYDAGATTTDLNYMQIFELDSLNIYRPAYKLYDNAAVTNATVTNPNANGGVISGNGLVVAIGNPLHSIHSITGTVVKGAVNILR